MIGTIRSRAGFPNVRISISSVSFGVMGPHRLNVNRKTSGGQLPRRKARLRAASLAQM